MTNEEILKNTTWDDVGIGTCSIHTNLFGRELPFRFYQDHQPKPSISDRMFESVIEFLALGASELERVKEMVYGEFLFSFHVSDYGFEPENGETKFEAHCRELGVSNKEEVFLKSSVKEIQFDQENDEYQGRYSEILIDCVSDNLISVVVKNGKLIDFDYDGCTLSIFEDDDQQAKKSRAKVLE